MGRLTEAQRSIRCGDHVHHTPTGEDWVVAWADPETDDLAWCGWPNGIARLSDCTRIKQATAYEHMSTLRGVLRCGDSRSAAAARLYPASHPALSDDGRG